MITVLLATYNGEKYLDKQIDSLLSQTYKDFNILIHDDGSSDNTVGIINDYITKYPDKISRIDAPATGSSKANFSLLLSRCDSDYIMFCDQDDVWFPQKIEKSFKIIKQAEEDYGKETPILVHSDLTVTDKNMHTIAHSFFEYQKLNANHSKLSNLLVQNCITGCTCIINHALKEKSGEIPKECAMHDWWLGLVAVMFGKIIFIDEPLIYYRQHGDNSVGAKNANSLSYVSNKLKRLNQVKADYLATYVQARILRQRFIKEADGQSQRILNAYCNMSELGKIKKIKLMNKYDFKKNTKLRILGQYIIV